MTVLRTPAGEIRVGDILERFAEVPDSSIDMVLYSPPYLGQRNYGNHPGQHGREKTVAEYIDRQVEVARQALRVLKPVGTLWVNVGDKRNGSGGAGGDYGRKSGKPGHRRALREGQARYDGFYDPAFPKKHLLLVPHRLGIAISDRLGAICRNDVIWNKLQPMPESPRDRFHQVHEFVLFYSKQARYHFDRDAVRVPHAPKSLTHKGGGRAAGRKREGAAADGNASSSSFAVSMEGKPRKLDPRGALRRSVWSIGGTPYRGEHNAVFPPELAEVAILAGCPPGGTVLDPYMGAGTTGLVCQRLGRRYLGFELVEASALEAQTRILGETKTEGFCS